jgi:gamma-glutamylcyclotransferase (GGCT)/AIG2-like uncharacterized protein YtfP
MTTQTPPKTELQNAILSHLRYGEENARTGKTLATILGEKDTRHIREEIVELRHQFYPIMGNGKGYFMAKSLDEIKEAKKYNLSYIKSLCIYQRDLNNIEKYYNGQMPMNLE